MELTRRDLLKTGAVGLSALVLPSGLTASSRAAAMPPVLVAVYLRGGADGLNLVVPAGDPLYYGLRPNIQVPAGSELALDGFFGLNPALAPLHPLYQSGDLCLIHACGSPSSSRSHFDAQDFMERAAPGDKSVLDGWLNRSLLVAGSGGSIEGISLKKTQVKALAGPAPSLAFKNIAGFRLTGQHVTARRAALSARYAQTPGSVLGAGVLDSFDALDVLASVPTGTTVPYPEDSDLGEALQDAAALIKAEVGVRVIAVDIGGWDHHSDETPEMNAVASELAASLAAFHADLGAHASATLTLCMTEFGRRARENGARGTDHGRAGVMMAMGGGIAGNRVLLADDQWPGLAPDDLDRGQDLAVTTDFRNVFAEALHRHVGIGVNALAPVFPDFSVDPAWFPGLYL